MISDVLRWSRNGWSKPFTEVDSDQTLVLAFGAPALVDDDAPIRALRDAFPRSVLVGCSTAGEILADQVLDHGLTVAVARFDDVRLTLETAEVADRDAAETGAALGARITARDQDVNAVFVLSDGLAVNGSSLVEGLLDALPTGAIVTGGLAADDDRFQRTWVIADGRAATGCITAVGLSGPRLVVGHGSRGGWDIFGPERMITRSEGNVLYELDGQPALDLYRHYLGDRASGLPATALLFPLAVRRSTADTDTLVRTILGIDEETRSMRFAGDVPEGGLAQLMRANFERVIDGASSAAEIAAQPDLDETLAIAISCVGRRLVLGERTEEELEATLDALGGRANLVGFYSYGEISPLGLGSCDLHNQTMTLTTLGERRLP
ncbi:MAG: FIST N-terminal domain-containing protein [Gaiellales bacterium]